MTTDPEKTDKKMGLNLTPYISVSGGSGGAQETVVAGEPIRKGSSFWDLALGLFSLLRFVTPFQPPGG
jgi:hypothetical protein